MRPGRAAAALLAVLAGCTDEPGPLDRDTIAALARTQGDAQGGARSGTWHTTFVQEACDCPSDLGQQVCLGAAFPLGVTLSVDVVEGDGVLLLSPQLAGSGINVFVEFTGPIDSDGTFSVGVVSAGFAFSAEGYLVGRIDAELSDEDHFAGTMALRLVGEFGGRTTDCGSTLELDGRRAL